LNNVTGTAIGLLVNHRQNNHNHNNNNTNYKIYKAPQYRYAATEALAEHAE